MWPDKSPTTINNGPVGGDMDVFAFQEEQWAQHRRRNQKAYVGNKIKYSWSGGYVE